MKRSALIIVAIFMCMSLHPVIANPVAPNDAETASGSVNVLSVDGFVTTKFASVGSDVDIQAYTRGHSSNTYVSADIVKYDIDPLDSMINTAFPGSGTFVDRVVLTSVGTHEDDTNTMVWQGSYTVPVSSMGGVYGASIIAEDGNLRAIDDSTQLRELFRGEAEKVLQAIDFAWDAANPTSLIKEEFEEVEQKATSHGGWSNFVATASEGSGAGGSQQLWNSMINAGHTQYNMSAGANFLETMMVYLDSEDVNASLSFITGLLLYANNFPLPRTFYDFEQVFEYIQTFDPIENFTRFDGTTDFEAAYNTLLGSNEWSALEQAIENLANNQKPFESMQIIMHNIALLAVSNHPQDIADALMTWLEPLMEGDFENMTPLQQLIVRWIEMAEELDGETDIQDTDGDEIPDVIMWQYEYLLQTSEGQAWTAKMQSSASWVNDAVNDFNTMPEDIIEHVVTSMDNPVWGDAGEAMEVFGDWIENASGVDRYIYWPDYEEEEEGEEGEEGPEPSDGSIVFRELYPVRTTLYETHVLELGIDLRMWGGDNNNYPESFSMSMTNLRGEIVNTNLLRDNHDMHRYAGILTASTIENTEWFFSQPLENYDGENIENAELRIESLRPSMLEVMLIYEGNDEIFMVSAAGVLVDQDETSLTGTPFTIDATTYDSAGEVQGADVDIAVIRISPQLGEEAVRTLEPEGEMEYTITSPNTLEGRYTGEDLDGDLSVRIMRFGEYHDDDNRRSSPQSYEFEEIELSGMGSLWDASSNLPSQRGLVEVVTSGTTVEGLEFEFMQQLPLPSSLGCARTQGSFDGKHVNMGYEYRTFEGDEGVRFDKPALESVELDWGDGDSKDAWVDPASEDTSSWESHDYAADGEYTIRTTYVDENGNEVVEEFQYSTYEGFWNERDEYYDHWIGTGECWMERDDSAMPTPEIIDNFITGGPVEVVKEQILVADSDGKVSLTITPQLPGVYASIVQSKITLPNGEVMTGLGVNFVAVTDASVSIGGLTEIATFAGLPVYSVEPGSSGLVTLTVNPSGIADDEFTASLGIASMVMDVPFPDIDWDDMSENQEYELEFQSGDTSRSQEVRFKAPISLIYTAIIPGEALWPSAVTAGIVLNNPAQLDLMGTLGPGQTTNIALNDDDGEASRILAIAAPSVGFDLTSLDFASLTSLIYEQGIRPEVGWIAEETKSTQICEGVDIWFEERYEDDEYSNVRIGIYQEHRNSDYYPSQTTPYPSNAFLEYVDGPEIDPVHDWQTSEWDERYVADFYLDPASEEIYTINTGEPYNSEQDFRVADYEIERHEEHRGCSGQEEMTEEEIFDLFDDFIGGVNSIAWGIGSSADLKLPYLASPISNFTVLGFVQQGSGDSATITAALGSQVAEPNPEPLVMKNLSLDFMPDNPSAGDSLLITATDAVTGEPVIHLSAVLLDDGMTIDNSITDSNGQASFILPEGELLVRVSGGMYNAAEFTITVTSDGTIIEESPDFDGDGISDEFDTDDDGDGILDVDDQCESTPIGTTVGPDGCPYSDTDSDNDGIMDGDDQCPNTPQGVTVESDGCEESQQQVDEDADLDGVNDSADLCPDTPVGEDTNAVGCSESQLDAANEEDPNDDDENNDDGVSESSEVFLGMDPLTLGGIGGGVLVLAILSLLFVRRGGGDSDIDWKYEEEDMMFESQTGSMMHDSPAPVEYVAPAAVQSGPPRTPPPGHQGHMSDGYEVSEYPDGSGSWWWKDPATGEWNEWS